MNGQIPLYEPADRVPHSILWRTCTSSALPRLLITACQIHNFRFLDVPS